MFFSHFYWRLARDLASLYLVFAGLVYLFQRKLQYFPDAASVALPHDPRYRGIETVNLTTTDGLRLFAWHWPGPVPATLVIFHGNAGHRGHRLDWIEDLHNLGYGVFALDYRGYGGSEGSPTEEGLYRDGEAALGWLGKQGIQHLVYFGESLGCAVAAEMANRRPPLGLILQSGFSSAEDVARKAYPYLPVGLLMKDRFDSKQKMAKILCPVLFIHGERDAIIPPKLVGHSTKLPMSPRRGSRFRGPITTTSLGWAARLIWTGSRNSCNVKYWAGGQKQSERYLRARESEPCLKTIPALQLELVPSSNILASAHSPIASPDASVIKCWSDWYKHLPNNGLQPNLASPINSCLPKLGVSAFPIRS